MPVTKPEWSQSKFRLLLITGALVLIAYFTIYIVFFGPSLGFVFSWDPDNVFKIEEVSSDAPSSQYLQPGDVILEVDGKPARWRSWSPLFTPGQNAYQMTIQRNGQKQTVTVPSNGFDIALIKNRATTGIISLLVWVVAALILLFATPQNREAWQLGLTTLGATVVLAASEAALLDVPGAWLLSSPFIPIVSVALVQVAFLPRATLPAPLEKILFRIFYATAGILGFLAAWEILYLAPRGSSFELLTSISSYEILLVCIAASAMIHLIILAWRFWQMPLSYQRRQVLIILVFTALAFLPLTLLTILPRVILGTPLLPWNLSIAFLALIPAGYGFVIHRRNYLGLDIFFTYTLTWLLLSFLLVLSYALIYYAFYQRTVWQELGPLPGSAALFLFMALVPKASQRTMGMAEKILYGQRRISTGSLLQLTSALAADPQIGTLKEAVQKVTEFLQVRQMALLLADHNGQLAEVTHKRINQSVKPISHEDTLFLDNLQLRQPKADSINRSLFGQYAWVECLAPLKVNGTVVGLLLLGRPVPDGYYNAQQIAYIHQVTGIIAVAVEAIRLFEASRMMSRELIQIRDTERILLATQIHDEPLQRISVTASRLGHLATAVEPFGNDLPDEIRTYSQELQATSKRLRDICAGLHPPALKQGAQWAVKDVVYAFRKRENLNIVLDMTVPRTLVIPHDLTLAIYHVLTEALNNVGKHAQAAKAWVKFAYAQETLALTVVDNGRNNLIASHSLSALLRSHRFGIVGMYEQADRVNGKLHIQTREEGGTAVSLTIPFANKSLHASEAGWEEG